MASVTQRIKQIKQPRGGYINPRSLSVQKFDDGIALIDYKEENIHPILVGLAVDYLVRLAGGSDPVDVFAVSLSGAHEIGEKAFFDAVALTEILTPGDVDGVAVLAACRLSGYDVGYRAGAEFYNPDTNTEPDGVTISHILTMVERSVSFFREFGPVTLSGFSFPGAFTHLVTSGDGDFLTRDTLWDFKVSVNPPTKDHTLQLLMYLLLGMASNQTEFGSVTNIGVFNPRLNTVYSIALSDIPFETVLEVATDVIGYPE